MYSPPPGRPVSRPPAVYINGNDTPTKRTRRWGRIPDSLREAIRADYQAGLPLRDIATKHGVNDSVVGRSLKGIANRRANMAQNSRPVRAPGETPQHYANRVMRWKQATDPAWRETKAARMSASIKKSWRKRKARAERERAKLEAEANVAIAALEDATMDVINHPAPPPPTLWQRIVGWFR